MVQLIISSQVYVATGVPAAGPGVDADANL